MKTKNRPPIIIGMPPTPKKKTVYLMRGLPSCGKSHLAERMIRQWREAARVETDAYQRYGWEPKEAQKQAWSKFCDYVEYGVPRVIVDRGNSLTGDDAKAYIGHARKHGYDVVYVEPDSPWWAEIRVLLMYRPLTWPALEKWADELSRVERPTKIKTSRARIIQLMKKWVDDKPSPLTYKVLNFSSQKKGIRCKAKTKKKIARSVTPKHDPTPRAVQDQDWDEIHGSDGY